VYVADSSSRARDDASASRALRLLAVAFAGVTACEWTVNIALSVWAFDVGGPLAVGLIGVRFLPAALAGVVAAAVANRQSRKGMLTWVPVIRAVLIAAVGATVLLHLPFGVTVVLAALDAMVGTAYRPAQAGLLPWLSRTPRQLAHAIATLGTTKMVAQVVGALAGGVVVATIGAGTGFLGVAAVLLLIAALTLGVESDPPMERRPVHLRPLAREALAAVRGVVTNRDAALIARFNGARALVRGLWLALVVVVVLDGGVDLGRSAVGAVWAAAGAGALLAMPATFALAGRRKLAEPFGIGLVLFGLPVALVAFFTSPLVELILIILQGAGYSFSEVTGTALLQRTVNPRVAAQIVGVMESSKLALEGLGAFLAPGLISLLGITGSLVATGLLLPALVIAGWAGLARADTNAQSRERETRLLRGLRLFDRLRLAELECVAATLRPQRFADREVIVRQGEAGRLFYVMAAGRAQVTIDGLPVRTLQAGDGFGEIALLRSVPRTATVTAVGDVEVYGIDRDDFLPAIAGDGARSPHEASTALLAALGAVPLLARLTAETLAGLAARASLVSVGRDTDIVREGDHGQRFYVLLKGTTEVLHDGTARRLLHPGDSFGEIAVLRNVPRTATVRALEDAELCAIEREDLARALGLDVAHSASVKTLRDDLA
jgi:CRP-like cAMP-binding protein